MRPFSIACCLLFAFTLCSQNIGTIETTSCFLEDCSFMKAQPETRFGYLTVPEDYSKPEGRTLQIAFSILKTPNPDFQGDPIMVFAGGWGFPEVKDTPFYLRFPFLAERDVILFDYRGSGFSTNLPCENLGKEGWNDILANYTNSEFAARQRERYNACLDRLQQEGIDFNQYGMNTIARDAAFLAQQLDYTTYNLFGISYGTMAMQHFLRAAEDYDITVRSAVFDSNVPIGVATQGSMGIYYARTLNRVLDACAENSDCNERFPNLKTRFLAFLDSVDTDPLKITMPGGELAYLNRHEINGALHQLLYYANVYKDFPILLEHFMARDETTLRRVLTQMQPLVEEGYNALGMIEYVYDYKGMLEKSKEAYQTEQRQYKPYEIIDGYYEFYVNDTRIQTDSIAGTPVRTSVPSLLLAGTFDPITPPEWNEPFMEYFTDAYYHSFPGLGHGVSPTPCGRQMVTKFLEDPSTDPEVACLEELEKTSIPFRTSYYKNGTIGTLLQQVSRLQPLWFVLLLVLTVVVVLRNVIVGAVFFRRKKDHMKRTTWWVSAMGLLFLILLGYFMFQTLNSDPFLLLFGLVAEANWLFFITPLFLLGVLYYLYIMLIKRSFGVWPVLTLVAFLFVSGCMFYYTLYPMI
ncbi:alpha/beta fold hydrolase [Altibacter sp.]|uniref:alpha/beta fold hydrolase n=1 Tax=Altibacter sp. TaxID=2024823 RepID=UPI000C8DEC84|nr:alpha/beta fold hydrolase [Altibacter sp.]MAP54438.1 hypothetical protein [Altibacter sp.]